MTDGMRSRAVQLLTRHEGVRLKPYRDTTGHLTIGVGRNLDDVGISKVEAAFLLRNDIEKHWLDLMQACPWVASLDMVRALVLLDMTFNMGIGTILTFDGTLEAIQRGDYEHAADRMLRTKWASQVGAKPGQRAHRLSQMMRTGLWPDEVSA
jgi:lysozyme